MQIGDRGFCGEWGRREGTDLLATVAEVGPLRSGDEQGPKCEAHAAARRILQRCKCLHFHGEFAPPLRLGLLTEGASLSRLTSRYSRLLQQLSLSLHREQYTR
ncbi:hypothetical protein PC118_g11708 [Phytophthora cactorum]|uniref:Uncharacterized protein n=1 Tax=Phytophthora cactorum TaxID=29920 RepID=A0A8T1FT96_9STRA|nr:hypothetical protein PC115_g11067 [Phytophthora cactorum]KAG2979526.1 hypothetical protein PC118_g11708 [Phytophthora cactorum]KAG3077747.1 hypothetical protein PC122_g12989 [Phytophthora cactorum]